MQATWYEKQGPAHDVLVVGTMAAPQPGPGEARIRVHASGINPGHVKKRQDVFGVGMPFPASSRTAMALESSIELARAYRRLGSGNRCGATARRATGTTHS
jgi:hypothetical protein